MDPSPDLNPEQCEALRALMRSTRFADASEEFLASAEGQRALGQHAEVRYLQALRNLAPWVDRAGGLAGRRVVEIGSGTGSSAAGFAAFAGRVDGYEIDAGAADIARRRFEILGVDNATVHHIAPQDSGAAISAGGAPDVVLLYAVLEHMTLGERHEVLRTAWGALPAGGLMVVTETPNRLAFSDDHTSRLPFFQMLPLEVAAWYFDRSPRTEFVESVQKAENREFALTRWGVSVSYHDFELSLECEMTPDIVVADGYEEEVTAVYPVMEEDRLLERYFAHIGLDVSRAFTRQPLNFVLRKPGG